MRLTQNTYVSEYYISDKTYLNLMIIKILKN